MAESTARKLFLSVMKSAAVVLLLAATLWAQQIPAGTALPVVLSEDFNTNKTQVGQVIVTQIAQDVPLPGHAKISAGSRVLGRIVQLDTRRYGVTNLLIKFDRLRLDGREIAIATKLRALASPLAVKNAQLPRVEPVSGESQANWTTTQVGGDDVYRGGGHVVNDKQEVVGDPGAGGVLAELASIPKTQCDEGSGGRRLALWVFGSTACGPYGFGDKIRAQNSEPAGEIILRGGKNIHLPTGTALLLIVIAPPPAPAAR